MIFFLDGSGELYQVLMIVYQALTGTALSSQTKLHLFKPFNIYCSKVDAKLLPSFGSDFKTLLKEFSLPSLNLSVIWMAFPLKIR